MNERLSVIPQLQRLLESEAAQSLCVAFSRQETVAALRQQLTELRENIKSDEQYPLPDFSQADFYADTRQNIEKNRQRSFRGVINATGIILHTNLGRAPMVEDAIDAIRETALGYSNLEFDLDTGKRGSRYRHIEGLLKKITGAEAAVVVNNCAAAVLVTLNTLAKDHEVIVSRGELIEIGGGFRMPDVIAATGAIMKETGTTNKTRVNDYEQAITDQTRVVLSNHCSNYQITGFTETPELTDLVSMAHKHKLAVVYDLGSGAFVDLDQFGIQNEKSVQQIIETGVDVVTFSGDKFLGGPQAGIILGRQTIIDRIRKNPLLRAMRIDKLSLAALEVTLGIYQVPEQALQQIPVLKMMSEDMGVLDMRARQLCEYINTLPAFEAEVHDDTGFIGGGSAPMNAIQSRIIRLTSDQYSAQAIAAKLRAHTPAIIGRISDDTFVMDLRTVSEDHVEVIKSAIGTLT